MTEESAPGPSLGLAVLGSTGSVGQSVERVVREHPERLRVVALAARGRNLDRLRAQVQAWRPKIVAVADPEAARRLRSDLPAGVELVDGPGAATEVVAHPEVERVVAAIVGAAGLAPVHAALAAGRDVALANKESLVVAGSLLMGLAAARGARVLPVDSEHAALHQALRGGRPEEVVRLVLTASGGPFSQRDLATFESITREEALAHPTWEMGAKISIDSATMMNKGLELIEATHLFSVPADRIEVVIHPQSIIHSLAEFCDGSWLAQLAANDMVFPVQYALAYPERWSNRFPRLEPSQLGSLELRPVDGERFPALALARAALAAGASAPAVLNAANEVAVEAFLTGEIRFPAISAAVEAVLERHSPSPVASLDDALAADAWGRAEAREQIASRLRI